MKGRLEMGISDLGFRRWNQWPQQLLMLLLPPLAS